MSTTNTKTKKPRQKYHVELYLKWLDDDGRVIGNSLQYEQDTWAVSEAQAINFARHNSGIPSHGHYTRNLGNESVFIEPKCTCLTMPKIPPVAAC